MHWLLLLLTCYFHISFTAASLHVGKSAKKLYSLHAVRWALHVLEVIIIMQLCYHCESLQQHVRSTRARALHCPKACLSAGVIIGIYRLSQGLFRLNVASILAG